MSTVTEILTLFETRGDSQYGGECVTQLEHALQAAALAQQENASPALIVAALLHDVGHLLHELPDDAPDDGVDDHHETSGYAFVRDLFPDDVSEPIRLHVPAKRYLCAVDSGYFDSLSEPSVVSLGLQGGPMGADEVEQFQQHPHYVAAVRLRQWDDAAKIPDLPTPPLSHYAPLMHQLTSEDPNDGA